MAVVMLDPQPADPEAGPGVRLDPALSYEAWRRLGCGLATGFDDSRWALGDWAAFGRDRYGRYYRDALFATGVDFATIGGYAAVARRFAPERRRDDLSFRHHAEVWGVAGDPVQNAWLAAAASGRWSWKELRRRLHGADGAAPATDRNVVVAADEAQQARWLRAASRSRCALDEWIAHALDHAASNPAFGH